MTPTIPDHYLWLGIGIFIFAAVKQVSTGLHTILTLTELSTQPPTTHSSSSASTPQPHHPNHQEDAISPTSLLTLATAHNTDIRTSATRILCARVAASPPARKALLRDLKSGDEVVKRGAQLALEMLCEMGFWKEGEVAMTGRRIGRWRVVERGEREWLDGRGAREDVRRRRREAVVIHDGEGAVRSEDVYMRGGGGEERPVDELGRDAVAIADVGVPFDRMAAWAVAAEGMDA